MTGSPTWALRWFRAFVAGLSLGFLAGAVLGVSAAGRAAFAQERGIVREIKVTCDRSPDCSSLKSIVESVTRECRTDDERAIALYNVCRYLLYHHAYPSEPGGISALKLINVYGWALCGGEHTVLAALFEAAGYPWRYRGWSNPGHTTVEVFYGGRWHYLDTFLKFYLWMPDSTSAGKWTIAGQEDIKAHPSLLTEGLVFDEARRVWYFAGDRFEIRDGRANWTAPALLVCGDSPESILSGVRSSRDAGSPRGWGAIIFDDPNYSTAIHLAPGYRLDLTWDKEPDGWYFPGSRNPPHHTCGDKDYRNCPAIGPILEPYGGTERRRTWSNGRLIFAPDFRSPAFLDGLEGLANVTVRNGELVPAEPTRPGQIVIPMSSPYVVAKAGIEVDPPDVTLEVSSDGRQFTQVQPQSISEKVRGLYRYWVRVTFSKPIYRLEVISVLQHNQEALPYLAPGRNKITVTVANPELLKRYRLVITYAYCLGWRDRTPEEICRAGAEIARGHYATWLETPTVVQRVIDRVPYEFEIVVPTPKGKQPVYPRMLLLRREVLAPGQAPAPVPTPPVEPSVGPGEELRELPTPWLIGTQPPSISRGGSE